MRKTIIGTGWHSDGKPRNSEASGMLYQRDYLVEGWISYFINDADGFHVYASDCKIYPVINYDFTSYSFSIRKPNQHHNNDYIASYLTGAMYAYCNECDFVYIEQDCLVQGFDRALEWAKKNVRKIAYGFGEYSPAGGWAETSFCFIKWEYIPEFIYRAMLEDWCFWKHGHDDPPYGEVVWHRLYKYAFTAWPFGYGRKRPINWEDPIFYAQQLTDEELERFIDLKDGVK